MALPDPDSDPEVAADDPDPDPDPDPLPDPDPCPDCPVCETCPPPIACPEPSPLDGLTRKERTILWREFRNFINQTRNNSSRHTRDADEMARILETLDEARQ